MNVSRLLNTAWMLACSAEAAAFHRATLRVAQTQAHVLTNILQRNRSTQFGQAHQFARVGNARAYQQHVPLASYDTYAEAVQRMGDGQRHVLTREAITLFQPTSGTSAGEKLIPYTASLRQQFQRAVAAWVFDLLWHRPRLRTGRAYWSISPAMGHDRRTAAGIPVGFDEDAAYLGGMERRIVEQLLVVPSAVTHLSDVESFHYCTLWFLLQAADLTSISIWNPSFLMSLLRPLETWHERLCFDLRRSVPQPPAGPVSEATGLKARRRGPGDRRATELEHVFRSTGPLADKLQQIWPKLTLISCWADAGAAPLARELGELFPGVELQPKGLMATEAAVSLPLLGYPGAALAIRSHFFEFQELESAERIRLAHELDWGGRYHVIVTTGGGLYRYQLRDEIEVVGFVRECPLLHFMGKSDCISDLVGEKLAEAHVQKVVHRALARSDVHSQFLLLVPVQGRPPRYRLFMQTRESPLTRSVQHEVAASLECGLRENPHYAYARRLGQLGPVEVHVLHGLCQPAWEIYRRRCLDRGIRAGDIKPLALDTAVDWPDVFAAAGGLGIRSE